MPDILKGFKVIQRPYPVATAAMPLRLQCVRSSIHVSLWNIHTDTRTMTAFAPSQIPTWITSLEQLAAWSATAIAELNPDKTVVINPGTAELAAQATDFRFNSDPENPNRYAVILYLPLNPTYRSAAAMRGVAEMSGATLPTRYSQA